MKMGYQYFPILGSINLNESGLAKGCPALTKFGFGLINLDQIAMDEKGSENIAERLAAMPVDSTSGPIPVCSQ